MSLLPMDLACLGYIEEHGGIVPTIAIPTRMFVGEIPIELPSLVELGMIKHTGDKTAITDAGRVALHQPNEGGK